METQDQQAAANARDNNNVSVNRKFNAQTRGRGRVDREDYCRQPYYILDNNVLTPQ